MIRIVENLNKILRPVHKKVFFLFFAPQLPNLAPKFAKSNNKKKKNYIKNADLYADFRSVKSVTQ